MLHIRLPFAASLLALALVSTPSVHAQDVGPDFTGQVQTTLPSNEQLLGQIQDALPTDTVAISDQLDISVTVSTGEDLVQRLTGALSLAPDDASRSRIEGV